LRAGPRIQRLPRHAVPQRRPAPRRYLAIQSGAPSGTFLQAPAAPVHGVPGEGHACL